jgi:hypothetical protein
MNSDTRPVFTDAGQAQTVDAQPEPFDLNEALNKELFDTAARQAREVTHE